MNLTRPEAIALAKAMADTQVAAGAEVILAVPFPFLWDAAAAVSGNAAVSVAAQNCHHKASGAFTGEVSAAMVASTGARYVILGHSERRAYSGEDDRLILTKMRMAMAHGLRPIYCCGERKAERDAGAHREVVSRQLEESILQLSWSELDGLIIAYEPVWAIGTGDTASPAQAEEMHGLIASQLRSRFGEVGLAVPLLYGGSVKASNARELFAQPHIDGGLIGGASLLADEFIAIANAF